MRKLGREVTQAWQAVAGRPLNRPGAAQRSGASGRLVDSETTDRGKEVCRSRFGDTGPETGNPGSEPSKKVSLDAESAHADTDSEARRIANGLLKLEGAGAIKNETDASFYAHLIRAFDAQYLGKVDSNPSKPSGILEHAEPGMAKHGKPSIVASERRFAARGKPWLGARTNRAPLSCRVEQVVPWSGTH